MTKNVSKEKFIDALTYDWELDFRIENAKVFYLEKTREIIKCLFELLISK